MEKNSLCSINNIAYENTKKKVWEFVLTPISLRAQGLWCKIPDAHKEMITNAMEFLLFNYYCAKVMHK